MNEIISYLENQEKIGLMEKLQEKPELSEHEQAELDELITKINAFNEKMTNFD